MKIEKNRLGPPLLVRSEKKRQQQQGNQSILFVASLVLFIYIFIEMKGDAIHNLKNQASSSFVQGKERIMFIACVIIY
jgi:hypothetical protein